MSPGLINLPVKGLGKPYGNATAVGKLQMYCKKLHTCFICHPEITENILILKHENTHG